MNKRLLSLLIILLALVIIIVGYYLYISGIPNKSVSITTNTTNPSSASSTNPRVSFNPGNLTTGVNDFGTKTSFTNPATGDVVSFKMTSGIQGTNPDFNSYVNGKSAGEIIGQGMSMETFSPNNEYFALRAASNLGCGILCVSDDIYVINLKSLSLINIESQSMYEVPKGTEAASYIQSYSWDTDGNIDATSYEVETDKTGLYIATPVQVWSYSPSSGKGTLLKTLQN